MAQLNTILYDQTTRVVSQNDLIITASLYGTASNATRAISASYSVTSSYSLNGGGGGPYTLTVSDVLQTQVFN
jgi:hypothetical protein